MLRPILRWRAGAAKYNAISDAEQRHETLNILLLLDYDGCL